MLHRAYLASWYEITDPDTGQVSIENIVAASADSLGLPVSVSSMYSQDTVNGGRPSLVMVLVIVSAEDIAVLETLNAAVKNKATPLELPNLLTSSDDLSDGWWTAQIATAAGYGVPSYVFDSCPTVLDCFFELIKWVHPWANQSVYTWLYDRAGAFV